MRGTMLHGRGLVLAMLVALLAGCAGSDEPTQPESTAASPATPGSEPTTTGSPSPAQASTCTDKRGDGESADIRSVVLREDGDRLEVMFELTSQPPSAGTVHWAILASSPSGDRALQLGVRFQDGKQIAHYVFDVGSADQKNLPGAASLAGAVLTTAFPYAAVAELGRTWKWSATTNVQGDDVDDCPDEGDDALNPRTVSFPS
jgi:hypothetical protein